MFRKILVANRGEIAIRAMRAAYELGALTVAVYPYEDRNSLHRLKADEAYLIGEEGHPVRAYLDVSEIIRVAKESGADAIYPGYGFLSENPDLAQAAAENGITFIGPGSHVLEMAGNKVTAKEHAIAAGVPVLKSTPASKNIDELVKGADEIGFPVFAKAVAGGGGRGMRRVDEQDDLREALEAAMREADSAFGDPDHVHRAGRRTATPHRGADPGRRARARPCTSSSATAPCSDATRRSSRSRRRRTSTRRSARRCTATRSRSRSRSAT